MKYIFVILFISLFNACGSVPAEFNTTIGNEKTILRVKVKSVEFTNYYPSEACSEITEPDMDCIVWDYWYRYEAKVKEVIQGEYSNKYIEFALLQHAPYIKKYTNDWYISLDTLDNAEIENKLKTNYYVLGHASSYGDKESVDELLNGG